MHSRKARNLAILILVLFSIIFATGNLQTSNQATNPFNDFMALESGVDLLSGNASFPYKIFTFSGRNGMNLDITLRYSSNVMFNVKATNDIAPTSLVGLGWSFGYGSIHCNHNNTASLSDDKFFWVSPEGLRKEIMKKGGNYYLESNPYWKVVPEVSANDNTIIKGWILINTEGKKFKYGDLDDDFERKATRYTFAWTKSVGEGWDYGHADFRLYPYQWDLATIEDINGNAINFLYNRIDKQVVNYAQNTDSGDKLYTQESYLHKIINPEGNTVEFLVEDKNADEYFDPYTSRPEPDGKQERYETKYLEQIIVKNQYDETLREFLFCYQFLNNKDDISVELADKPYLKRILTKIKEQNDKLETLYSTSFQYNDDIDSTEGFPHYSPDYNYGALRSITSSLCGKMSFEYKRTEVDAKIAAGKGIRSVRTNVMGRVSEGNYYFVRYEGDSDETGLVHITVVRNNGNSNKSSYYIPELKKEDDEEKLFYIHTYGDIIVLAAGEKRSFGKKDLKLWIWRWKNDAFQYELYNYDVTNPIRINNVYVGNDYVVATGGDDNFMVWVLNYNKDKGEWEQSNLNGVDLDTKRKTIHLGKNYIAFLGGRNKSYIWVYNWNAITKKWEKSVNPRLWDYRHSTNGNWSENTVYTGDDFFVFRGGYDGESLWFYNWNGTKWVYTHYVGGDFGNNEIKDCALGDNYVVVQGGKNGRRLWGLHWDGSAWVTGAGLHKVTPKDKGSEADNLITGGNNFVMKRTGTRRDWQFIYNWDGKKWEQKNASQFIRIKDRKEKIDQILAGNNMAITRWYNGSRIDIKCFNGKDWDEKPLRAYKGAVLGGKFKHCRTHGSPDGHQIWDWHSFSGKKNKFTRYHFKPRHVIFSGDFAHLYTPAQYPRTSVSLFRFMNDLLAIPYSYTVDKRIMDDGTGDSTIISFDYSKSWHNFNYNSLNQVFESVNIISGIHKAVYHEPMIGYQQFWEPNITKFLFDIHSNNELFGSLKSLESGKNYQNYTYKLYNYELYNNDDLWPIGINQKRLKSQLDVLGGLKSQRDFLYNELNGKVDVLIENKDFPEEKHTKVNYAFEEKDPTGELIYSGMDGGMQESNMLSQVSETKAQSKDGKILSASTNTWTNTKSNGQWLSDKQYIWNAKNSDITYTEFNFADLASNPKPWQYAGENARYDQYGITTTIQDAVGTKSSTIMARGNSIAMATIQNADYEECAAFTCDYDDDIITSDIPPVKYLDQHIGWMKDDNCLLVKCIEEKISPKFSENVLKLTGGTVSKELNNIDKTKDYVFSVWATTIGVDHTGKLIIEKVDANETATLLKQVTINLDGVWKFFATSIQATELTSVLPTDKIRISIEGAYNSVNTVVAMYINDIRFHPKKSLVATMYYHPKWQTLAAAVDANNNAAYTDYNEFGLPIINRNNNGDIVQKTEYDFKSCYADVSDNLLKKMEVTDYDISFDPYVNEYTLVVPKVLRAIDFYAEARNPEAYITVNGMGTLCPCSQTKTIPLNENTDTYVYTDVRAPNGNLNEYDLRIIQYDNCWRYTGTGVSATENSTDAYDFDARNTDLYLAYRDNTDTKIYLSKYDYPGEMWNEISANGIESAFDSKVSLAYPYLAYLKSEIVIETDPQTNETFEKIVLLVDVQYFNGASWESAGSNPVSQGFVEKFVLALDRNGVPYIAYKGEEGTEAAKIIIKKLNGTSWEEKGSPLSVPGKVENMHLTVNYDLNPHLSFIYNSDPDNDDIDDQIVVKRLSSSNVWQDISPTLNASEIKAISFAYENTNASNTPFLAYNIDGNITVLRYAANAWSAVGAGDFLPLGSTNCFKLIDLNGNPALAFISYYNFNKLSAIKWDGSNWVKEGNPAFTKLSSTSQKHLDYLVTSGDDEFMAIKSPFASDKVSVLFYDDQNCPDATLQSLSVTSGGDVYSMDPVFKPYITKYYLTVENSASTIEINAQTADPQAEGMRINGITYGPTALATLDLITGDNEIELVVTAEDGHTKVKYYLFINRAPSSYVALCNIELFDKNEAPITYVQAEDPQKDYFDPNVTSYSANISLDNDLITFKLDNRSNATILLGGTVVTDEFTVQPAFGQNIYTITLLAEDNVTKREYDFYITRDVDPRVQLSGLSVNQGGTLSPSFSSNVYSYTVAFASDVTSVAITANADAPATIIIKDKEVPSGTASDPIALEYGGNGVGITVQHPDVEQTLTYALEIIRDPIDDIVLETFSVTDDNAANVVLDPNPFDAKTFDYRATVAQDVEQITFHCQAKNPDAIVRMGPLDDVEEISNLQFSENTVLASIEYNVAGTLAPVFDPEILEYTIIVDASETAISFDVTGDYENIAINDIDMEKVCFLQGVEVNCEDCGIDDCDIKQRSLPIPLAMGRNVVLMVLEGYDGISVTEYKINVIRGSEPTMPTTTTFDVGPGNQTYGIKVIAPDYSQSLTYELVVKRLFESAEDPSISFTKSKIEVVEGNKTIALQVKLSSLPLLPVQVDYELVTSGTTAKPDAPEQDFVLDLAQNTLTYEPCEEVKEITIDILEDYRVEEDETIQLRLTNQTNATAGKTMECVVLIKDNDFVKAAFNSPGPSIHHEGNSGIRTISLPVDLSAGSTKEAIVRFAIVNKSSGLEGNDYQLNGNKLVYRAGVTRQYLEVGIKGDLVYEDDDWFELRLFPDKNIEIGDIGRKTFIIKNDDLPPPTVSFDITGGQSLETSTLGISVVATLSHPLNSQDITVPFSLGGNALADVDYTITSPTPEQFIVFPAGITDVTIDFEMINDNTPEGTELFTITLEDPQPHKLAELNKSKHIYTHLIHEPQPIGPVIYVDQSASIHMNTGTEWGFAFLHLQDGLECARNNAIVQEIRVAEGFYYPDQADYMSVSNDNRYETFSMVDGVRVIGGYPAGGGPTSDPKMHVTTLSGDIDGNTTLDAGNSFHVVTGAHNAQIEGVTITQGYANGSSPHERGGAVYNQDGQQFSLLQCRIVDNYALYQGNVHQPYSVDNCHFENNHTSGEEVGRGGGAIWTNNTMQKLENSTFYLNVADGDNGGAINIVDNDGINQPNNLVIRGCTFTSNRGYDGGAIALEGTNLPQAIINCTFIDNYNSLDGSGGAVIIDGGSDIRFGNCVFYRNRVDNAYGGAIYIHNIGSTSFQSCTFVENSSLQSYCGAIYGSPGSGLINVDHVIFWNNNADYIRDIATEGSGLNISHCIVQEHWHINNNNCSLADPLFKSVNSSDDNFLRLEDTSPCRNAGDQSILWLLPYTDSKDLAGNPRINEGEVDFGAYEY